MDFRASLFALAAFAAFAVHDVFIKLLGGGYSSFQVLFFSVLFGFPLTILMLLGDRTEGTLIPQRPGWTILRTAVAVCAGVTVFYAFSVLPLAQVYAILFAIPLLVTALSVPILGEVVRLRRWIAVLIGLGGVLVVLRPGSTDLNFGHAAAVTAAVCSALASTIVRKIGSEERPVVLLIYPMVASFVASALMLPFVYQPMPIRDLGLAALIALFAHMATRFIIQAYRTGEASTVAPMQYSQIIWAGLFGYVVFDEVPDAMTFLGAAIIILSGIYILWRENRPGLSQTTPVSTTRGRVETSTHPRPGAVLPQDGTLLDD